MPSSSSSSRKDEFYLSFDLGIQSTVAAASSSSMDDMFITLSKLGYHGCAINHNISESSVSTHNYTNIRRQYNGLPKLPDDIAKEEEEEEQRAAIEQLNSFGIGDEQEGFIVLNRVTVKMGRSENLCHLERLQSYDIVALTPESDAVIWTLLGDNTLRRQVDIISLDLSTGNGLPQVTLKRGLIEAIRKAGLFIELNIGDYMRAIGDQRPEILARGAYILRWSGHGDGVIFTSGALTIMDIRTPDDIDNWARICLEEGTYRHRRFITTSEAVVRHGIWRRSESGIILLNNNTNSVI